MKNKRSFYQIALLVMCLTILASIVAAALPHPAQAAPKSDPNLTFFARIDRGKVYINISKIKDTAKYQVKLRDAVVAKQWYKMGSITLEKNTATSFTKTLPKPLAKKLYIQVCLKNQKNDRLNCGTVVNPGT